MTLGPLIVTLAWAAPAAVWLLSSRAVRAELRVILTAAAGYWRSGPAGKAAVLTGLTAVAWSVAVGGSKAHTERGIVLTRCLQTRDAVELAWRPDDARIVDGDEYTVYEELPGGGLIEHARTAATNYTIRAFTPQKNRRYFIAVEKDLPEGGAE